jgi:hypothetical protein
MKQFNLGERRVINMTDSSLKIEVGGLSEEYPSGTRAKPFIIVSDTDELHLDGARVVIEDDTDSVVASALLRPVRGAKNSFIAEDLCIDVPFEPEEYYYLIKCFAEAGEPNQPIAQAYFSLKVVAHKIKITVRSPYTPVIANEMFEISVGVRCDGECAWEGINGAIWEDEQLLHRFTLTRHPVATKSEKLYDAVLNIPAPHEIGKHKWRIEIDEHTNTLPHIHDPHYMYLSVCGTPVETFRVCVKGNDTGEAIGNAEVTIVASDGLMYSARTDALGIAEIGLPSKGGKLWIRGARYDQHEALLQPEDFESNELRSVVINYKPIW